MGLLHGLGTLVCHGHSRIALANGLLGGVGGQVFSDVYIRELGRSLKAGLDAGRFGVVTVALSPSTTGSWQLAESLLSLLLEPFPDYAAFKAGAPGGP